MPALTLFGRRWRISTDDFVIPSLFDLFFTVLWLIASAIVYWKSDSNLEFLQCANGNYMKLYLYGVFTILHLIIVTSIVLITSSKNGNIMDTGKRRFVPPCLYIRLFLQVVQICWNTLGTVWAFQGVFDCPTAPGAVNLVIGFIICSWVMVGLAVIGIFIVFDPLGGTDEEKEFATTMDFFRVCANSDSVTLSDIPDTKLTRVWTRRLRYYLLSFNNWSNSSKNAFHESGKLFGAVFAKTDLVPTDVAAGMILLALRNKDANKDESELQKAVSLSNRSSIDYDYNEHAQSQLDINSLNNSNLNPAIVIPQVVTVEPLKLLSSSSPSKSSTGLDELFLNEWRNPVLFCHFLKYAMSTYSWPIVLFDRKPGAIRRLFKRTFLCQCLPFRHHPLSVTDDDFCFCHTAGVREFSGIDDEQLVHLCFKNKVYNTPFFVSKDPETKTIVLAIRGTMSMTDLLTDMSGWPSPIDFPGLPPTFKGHHGMILCAKDVHQQLKSLNILPKLFEENPDYKLVITGTSLGAGTATIMSMMMKSQYPDLKCYAFSPPGGLLSLDAAEYCNDFVTSIVYGNDLVPRLSIRSIEKLKFAVQDAIEECKSPKYRILLGGLSMIRGKRPKTINFASGSGTSSSSSSMKNNMAATTKAQSQSNNRLSSGSTCSASPSSVTVMTELDLDNRAPDSLEVLVVDEEAYRRRSQEMLISPKHNTANKSQTNCDNNFINNKMNNMHLEISCNKKNLSTNLSKMEETESISCSNNEQIESDRLRFPCCEMYMPGRVVFITETEKFHSGHNKPDYKGESRWRIRWAERTEFMDIVVHGRLLGDHLPYRMYKAMKVLAGSQEKIAPNPLNSLLDRPLSIAR